MEKSQNRRIQIRRGRTTNTMTLSKISRIMFKIEVTQMVLIKRSITMIKRIFRESERRMRRMRKQKDSKNKMIWVRNLKLF